MLQALVLLLLFRNFDSELQHYVKHLTGFQEMKPTIQEAYQASHSDSYFTGESLCLWMFSNVTKVNCILANKTESLANTVTDISEAVAYI